MGGTHFSGPLYQMGGAQVAFGSPHTEVFYVNGITWANGFGTGNDANSGTSPDSPFMTLTKAVDSCTTEANSIIYLLDYYQPTGETWPVVIDKNLINIIGVGNMPSTKWIAMYADSEACIDITGSDVYIENVSFFANASYAGVTMDSGCKHVWLNNCYFGQGTYGVELEAGDTGFGIAITDSFFIATLSAGGIYVADDPAGLVIERNRFDRHTGISIDVEAGAYASICDNRFAMKAATSGISITLASAVSRAFVDGNHAAYGANSTSVSPYKDEGTVETNNWGTNWYGKAVADPA